LAATEFWSGIISYKCEDPQQEEYKIKKIFEKLDIIMFALFECCKFTEHDKMAMMPSKENDVNFDEKRGSK